jgi:hypothetical protein
MKVKNVLFPSPALPAFARLFLGWIMGFLSAPIILDRYSAEIAEILEVLFH